MGTGHLVKAKRYFKRLSFLDDRQRQGVMLAPTVWFCFCFPLGTRD